jgi:hypothetical protein
MCLLNSYLDTYKPVILYVVLYVYKTWYLGLRAEKRLRVLENREMGRIFNPKRHDATEE